MKMVLSNQSERCFPKFKLIKTTGMPMGKIRLDKMLVLRGLVPTLEKARALILAKAVRVGDVYPDKAGFPVGADAQIHLKGEDNPYVSRGGLKLKGALTSFALDVAGLVAFDVGASTGGFTDCLLHEGVRKVYALDVGYGQLAWKLREDKRVVTIERTNIRYYEGADFEELPDIATIDVSFISLKSVLPSVLRLTGTEAIVLALIKPQFEVRREEVGPHGVVKDMQARQRVVEEVISFSKASGLLVEGTCVSPLLGPEGNSEFFVLARKTKANGS
jgi:23S rRNA (cytidine1920-2'-O)/16S rRNA (cytidine1409-2'-O)-methyltransferase